jgi:AraC-like DNA-binding protein
VLFLLLFFLVFSYRYRKNREKKGKYSASTLESWKSQHYLQKLLSLMEKEKPYRDPEITVEKLSNMLDISEKHLSQILNERLQLNFNNFVNKYRVEEAQKKILDPKEKDFVILKIAYDVGFNSKSAFNAAFKKFTQMSPSEFRKINS